MSRKRRWRWREKKRKTAKRWVGWKWGGGVEKSEGLRENSIMARGSGLITQLMANARHRRHPSSSTMENEARPDRISGKINKGVGRPPFNSPSTSSVMPCTVPMCISRFAFFLLNFFTDGAAYCMRTYNPETLHESRIRY